ncbi:MAG: RluA family pseudouridine synthase [Eubacterium sp.]|nr:RluA family pseudouridine synthase [Eubacterium sp.]
MATDLKNRIKILYEDRHILVCVKPAGIAAQTKLSGQQDMVSLLCNYRHEKGEEPYAGLVHRLDQPVEGILVFGRHTKSTAALCKSMAQGGFSKGYLAVTLGEMPAKAGRLTDYLIKDGRRNLSAVAGPGDAQAKKAELLYKVLKTDTGSSPVQNLVKIRLLTGRHHQIRVQMAHLGTPLAGDTKYGIQPCTMGGGLGLCACELEFMHPFDHKKMRFEISPSQPVFQAFGSFCF